MDGTPPNPVFSCTRCPGRPCRYAEAILSCVQQLGLLASGQQPDPGGVDSDDGLGIFLFFLGSTAAVMGWAWLSNRKRSKRYKVSVTVCIGVREAGVTACRGERSRGKRSRGNRDLTCCWLLPEQLSVAGLACWEHS